MLNHLLTLIAYMMSVEVETMWCIVIIQVLLMAAIRARYIHKNSVLVDENWRLKNRILKMENDALTRAI